ncbi:MAG: arginine--tRNA ligase [Akkermansiaceae bacterium]|nr:arginine--tRNA ligase [Armatimonadota bacterium]
MDTPLPYVFDRLRTEATALIAATGLVAPGSINLAEPKANVPADLAFPVFASAKDAGTNPNDFAKRLADAVTLSPDSLFARVEPAGGFVNFSVRPDVFASAVLADIEVRGNAYGEDKTVGKGNTVIVEYSSPNIAKKLHVGSLRTTVIGHSLYLILKSLGYNVIGDNHLGDWGTQFGYILAAIHDKGFTPWDDPNPVPALMKIYADYNNEAESNPSIKDNARAWFKKLEDGDPWARETWQRIITLSLAEFDKTYSRLDIRFDTQVGESFFEPVLDQVIQEAIDKGVATAEPNGPVAVDFGEKLPSCLLRKTDGGTLYQTRDLATVLYRWREYHPTRNIYVVGAEQRLHFQQVFEIARRMGYVEIADRSVHIPNGMVTKADGDRFRARKGEVIFADEILDEAAVRAEAVMRQQIADGKSEVSESEIDAISELLGVGAVIYSDLHQGPDRNIQFDWDKMLALNGNTATYNQYMHARCKSILRKAPVGLPTADPRILTAPEEQAVLKHLARLPQAVRDAGEKFLPATVAEWTYTLAKEFSRFYDKCPVLKAETDELKAARLAIVAASAQGLKNGLALLGIGVPDRM